MKIQVRFGNGIDQLERKVAEIEALMKGLTDEMVDIKGLYMKIQRDQKPAQSSRRSLLQLLQETRVLS